VGTPIGKWVGMRRIGFVLLLAVVLAGCSVPASEAPRNAVEQTSSALNAAHWAVELNLAGRSSNQVTQVILQESVAAVAQARSGLAETSGTSGEKSRVAGEAMSAVLQLLTELRDRPPTAADLERFEATSTSLAAAEQAVAP
jgi:hypothetical protein